MLVNQVSISLCNWETYTQHAYALTHGQCKPIYSTFSAVDAV